MKVALDKRLAKSKPSLDIPGLVFYVALSGGIKTDNWSRVGQGSVQERSMSDSAAAVVCDVSDATLWNMLGQ